MEKEELLFLDKLDIYEIRAKLRDLGGTPADKSKEEIIKEIIQISNNEITPTRSNRGRKSNSSKMMDAFSGLIKRDSERFNQFSGIRVADVSKKIDLVSGIVKMLDDGSAVVFNASFAKINRASVLISQQTIKDFELREGDFIVGKSERIIDENIENVFEVYAVNGDNPKYKRDYFEMQTPCYPNQKLDIIASDEEAKPLQLIDMFAPIGKGQRGIIVAPQRAGKSALIKQFAKSIKQNNPNVSVMVLLVDERPEEVAEIKNCFDGSVIYSLFDERPETHVERVNLVLSRAKRLAEMGEDVVVLLDSLNNLVRAHNQTVDQNSKALSCGIHAEALYSVKKFLGSARNLKEAGSLTIIATVQTENAFGNCIYEEIESVCNWEVFLQKQFSFGGVFPIIDIVHSETRNDNLLLSLEEYEQARRVRAQFGGKQEAKAFAERFYACEDAKNIKSFVSGWLKEKANKA